MFWAGGTFHITEALPESRQVVYHCPFQIDEFVDAPQLRPGNKFPWFLYPLVVHTPRSIVNNASQSESASVMIKKTAMILKDRTQALASKALTKNRLQRSE